MKNLLTAIVAAVCINASAQGPQPVRPDNFTPYKYQYTVEQLNKMFSAEIMDKAKKAAAEMEVVIKNGPYKPNFDKINRHRLPEWYKDAKFGVFLDWGLWSTPAYGRQGYHGNYYPDTYLGYMYGKNRTSMDYHVKYWGADFHRDDFIPMFTAEKFNADQFAQLCVKWGAKYVVPFSKHQDGYCQWNNSYTRRDAVDMTPHRDILKEMYDAFRKNNIKCGFYYTIIEFDYPVLVNGKLTIREAQAANDPAVSMSGYTDFDSKFHNRTVSGKIPVNDFISDYFVPSMKEVIDVYDPDILWYDCDWYQTTAANKTDLLTAYFFDKAEGRKEVAVNDRLGNDSREKAGDFYTSEYNVIIENFDHYWEENRPMGNSYGYNWTDNDSSMMSSERLIEMLVRIVARNGNLILMVCPDAKFNIPQAQMDRMNDIGEWLKVNGEAIYNTRPAIKPCDKINTGDNIWYTQSKDGKYTYAHFFEWPYRGFINFMQAKPKWESKAYLLGCDKPLKWWATEGKEPFMYVEMPAGMTEKTAPCKHAWVVRFENW